jgi:hypothetical protein
MLRRIRRGARFAASIATMALVAGVFASCVSAAEMTSAQKACCAAMEHDCGEMAIEAGCCAPDSQSSRSLTPVGLLAPVLLPPPPSTPPVELFVLSPPLSSAVAGSEAAVPRPPGVSTYLLISTFRI